jgi:hypothetical protein
MEHLEEMRKRILANSLLYAGFFPGFSLWLASFAFIAYYSFARTVVPRSDLGWTVRILWAKTYGRAEERERLFRYTGGAPCLFYPQLWVCFCGGSGDQTVDRKA